MQPLKTYRKLNFDMTKADIVSRISEKLGIEKGDVQATVETFMEEVKTSLENGDNVYLRGFGSFIVKTRAEKLAGISQKIQLSKYQPTTFRHLSLQRSL